MTYIQKLSANIYKYKAEDIIAGDFLIESFDPKALSNVFENINIQNSFVLLGNPKYKYDSNF